MLYSTNLGKTNSHTFRYFLLKLCSHLDGEDVHWRERTVIMLDNASSHKGVPVSQLMAELRLPVLFMGPYHFRMAPVEMLFNLIKGHDLNTLRSTINTR